MARISQQDKDAVTRYAHDKGIDLRIADICKTKYEVDVIYDCMVIIKANFENYQHASALAPKNPTRTEKDLKNKLLLASTEQETEDIINEFKAVSPWYSDIKLIKNDVLGECRDILKNAKFGKKRIGKIIPLLTWYLMDSDELSSDIPKNIIDLINSF